MKTADAVRLLSLLEEVVENAPADALNAAIVSVLQHIRPCIPSDEIESFDRYCARQEYLEFVQRMDAGRSQWRGAVRLDGAMPASLSQAV